LDQAGSRDTAFSHSAPEAADHARRPSPLLQLEHVGLTMTDGALTCRSPALSQVFPVTVTVVAAADSKFYV